MNNEKSYILSIHQIHLPISTRADLKVRYFALTDIRISISVLIEGELFILVNYYTLRFCNILPKHSVEFLPFHITAKHIIFYIINNIAFLIIVIICKLSIILKKQQNGDLINSVCSNQAVKVMTFSILSFYVIIFHYMQLFSSLRTPYKAGMERIHYIYIKQLFNFSYKRIIMGTLLSPFHFNPIISLINPIMNLS